MISSASTAAGRDPEGGETPNSFGNITWPTLFESQRCWGLRENFLDYTHSPTPQIPFSSWEIIIKKASSEQERSMLFLLQLSCSCLLQSLDKYRPHLSCSSRSLWYEAWEKYSVGAMVWCLGATVATSHKKKPAVQSSRRPQTRLLIQECRFCQDRTIAVTRYFLLSWSW